ncbi:formylglycine-generating enzyme family protein, partial [Candidatus Omnitrophota bacterium]
AQWGEIMSKIYNYYYLVKPYYIAPSYDNTSPISNIIPGDMAIFCNILSSISGYTPCYRVDYQSTVDECNFNANGYRLPTEAEWEYACRAGTSTPFNTGSGETDLAEAAWYTGNGKHHEMSVGEKKPNRWGLYDMHGNVSEVCNDTVTDEYFGSSPMSNPGEPVMGQSIYVVRGGNYSSPPYECRSAYRGSMVRRQNLKYSKETTVGFRIVRNADS